MDDEGKLEDPAREWRGTRAWVRAVILARVGRTAAEVAEALGCCLRSVRSRMAA